MVEPIHAKYAVAGVVRDWIHETPLSLCGPGADECPDWPKANELADLIVTELDRRGFLVTGAYAAASNQTQPEEGNDA